MTNFLAKVAQIFCNFMCYFKTIQLSSKNDLVTFWAMFGKIGQLLIPSGHTDATPENVPQVNEPHVQ